VYACIAVGTFDPAIEIWNLDVMDPLEPTAVLGGAVDPSSRRKKKALRPGSHEAAVLGMSWNQTYRPALASASADSTVKIWDVTTQTCSHTFTHHTDKAQAVQWHPKHAWLLASGSFDKTIALLDCRSAVVCAVYQLPSDVEAMVWNPFDEHVLYTAVENGEVVAIDVRNTAYALFSFQAHDATVSSLAFSHRVPGLMATASVDKTVRMWDTASAGASQQPRMVAYKTMNVGKLFALQFSTDDPFMLATAGDQGMLAVWMSSELEVIRNTFYDRVGQEQAIGEAQDFIIGSEDLIAERPEVASLMGGGEADEDNNNEVRISKSSVLKKKKKKNKLLS
jgi:periodic tryptophan protein 1